MQTQIITFLALLLMIIAAFELKYYTSINKRIIFEDKIWTHLNKTLSVKSYEKLFETDFKIYQMQLTSKINEELFDKFSKFYTEKVGQGDSEEELLVEQPLSLHIVFINKIDGYVFDSATNSYDLFIKNSPIAFNISDKEKIGLIDRFFNIRYNEQEEFNIEGVIKLNNKIHFLSDLTSISSYKNTIGEEKKVCSDLVFNFGPIIEVVRFENFKDSFDYLFYNDNSDIRLMQKIANTSIIIERKDT